MSKYTFPLSIVCRSVGRSVTIQNKNDDMTCCSQNGCSKAGTTKCAGKKENWKKGVGIFHPSSELAENMVVQKHM